MNSSFLSFLKSSCTSKCTLDLPKINPKDGQGESLTFESPFSSDVLGAFNCIQKMARTFSIFLDVPEIVFVGFSDVGKTALIESFLGTNCLSVKPTKRCVHYQFRYVENKDFSIVIKSDPKFPSASCTLDNLASEIEKRNYTTDVPLIVVVENAKYLSMTLIDTPGISNDLTNENTQIVVNCCQQVTANDSKRVIVAVDSCDPEATKSKVIELLSAKVNFSLRIITNVGSVCSSLNSDSQVLKIFMQRNALLCFGVDVLSQKERLEPLMDYNYEMNAKSEQLRKIAQDLGCNFVSHNLNFGFNSFFSFVLKYVKKCYQMCGPTIQILAKNSMRLVSISISHVSNRVDSFSDLKLNQQSMNILSKFFTNLDLLLSDQVNVKLEGETSEQERDDWNGGKWTTSDGTVLTPLIEGENKKLFGKAQFERLLKEYKNVCDKVQLEPFSADDVYTYLGLSPITPPDTLTIASAAIELAKKALVASLLPLAIQLNNRGKYIMKTVCRQALHLVSSGPNTIPQSVSAPKMLAFGHSQQPFGSNVFSSFSNDLSQQSVSSSSQNLQTNLFVSQLADFENDDFDINNLPYFATWISESFDSFVMSLTSDFERKILEEFQCIAKLTEDEKEKKKRSVLTLVYDKANEIFEENKTAIIANVSLKFHNCYLIDNESQLSRFQTEVIEKLGSERLNDLFETETNKKRLNEDLESVKALQKSLNENEITLNSAIDKLKG